jgi:O-acetyl-ADP-ribose deacetylase (regulator of RNase III)
MDELDKLREQKGGCPTGEAVITGAGNLPAKYVIHTVGPVWSGGTMGEAELLESAYMNSLKLANQVGLESVSFPNISTGVYGYPKKEAAKIAIQSVQEFLKSVSSIKRIIFVCYDEESFNIYHDILCEKGFIP